MRNFLQKQRGSGDLIDVQTTRYSELLRRILNQYGDGTLASVDGKKFSGSGFTELIKDWCKNARICRTRDFSLTRSGVPLFGFHDHPSEFWAVASELPFIQQLAEEGIVRSNFGYTKKFGP